MRILMILIADSDAGAPSGFFGLCLEGVAAAFYVFRDSGAEVVLASSTGGFVALGLTHERTQIPLNESRFRQDSEARDALSDTVRLDQVYVDDFEAALCLGRPGPIGRKTGETLAAALIVAFFAAGKPVGLVPANLELTHDSIGKGLLVTGSSASTPELAARALLGAITKGTRTDERTMR